MKKLICIILCIILCLGGLSPLAYGEETIFCELYSIGFLHNVAGTNIFNETMTNVDSISASEKPSVFHYGWETGGPFELNNGSCSAEVSAETAYTGSQSIHVQYNGLEDNGNDRYFVRTPNSAPYILSVGKTYKLTMYVKELSNDDNTVGIEFGDTGFISLSDSRYLTDTEKEGWKRFEIIHKVNSTSANNRLYIIARWGKADVYIDSISMAEVAENVCNVSGRIYTGENRSVNLTVNSADGGTYIGQDISNNDGTFEISFAAAPNVYSICAEFDGKTFEKEIDLSFMPVFFEGDMARYGVHTAKASADGIELSGNFKAAANSVLALQIMEKAISPGIEADAIKDIREAECDESGNYTVRFNVTQGEYTLYLLASDYNVGACDISIPNLKLMFAKSEESFSAFMKKLSLYADNLQEKIQECELKNISTDYERAYLEIIRKYIEWLEVEAKAGDYSRMGNYNYSLTRIYNEAIENLDAYLSGDKKPVSVPKYSSNGIRFDGTTVLAETDNNGISEERPVFLTGYGIWNTVVEEMPFLASIGHNFIQSEAYMDSVLTPVRGGGWITGGRNDNGISEVEIKSTTDASSGGNYSIKVTNPGEPLHNVFRTLGQKFVAKPNTTYVYGLKAKGKGIVPNSKTEYGSAWFNLNGIYSGIRCNMLNSEEWAEYSFEYTTGAKETSLEFLFVFQNVIDELYIDDVYVKEKGSDVNLLLNGDFENYPQNPTEDDALAEAMGWYINYSYLDTFEDILKRADEYGVAVDVILNPAEMPDFIRYSDPEITAAGSGYMDFAIDNSTVRKAIGIYARAVADAVKGYDSAVSMCITNEPEVKAAYYSDYYNTRWVEFLKTKYGNNLRSICSAHNKIYLSFNNVSMPTSISSTPVFYDYMEFNDGLLAEFHKWYVGEIRKVNDEIPLHTKTMQYLRDYYKNYFLQGTNYELVADTLDLNGCDAWSLHSEINTLSEKMAWYDMMVSLSDKPVWNTEDHLTETGITQTLYSDAEPMFVAADIWNGAVHGRGASAIWVLNDSSTMVAWNDSKHSNSNVLHKPEQMMQTAKVAMDLNRLSDEITALQKEKPKVGILYSRTSVGYNENHTAAVLQAYNDAIQSGQKVGFITDSTYDHMSEYELIIVPEATNVSAKLLNAVKTYTTEGGTLLIFGDGALKKDEHNKAQNTETLNNILQHSDTSSSVSEKILEMGLSDILLIDEKTGKVVENVEWSYTQYNGDYIINVLNYDLDGCKNVKIELNGNKIIGAIDLRSGSKAIDGIVEVNAITPMLISVPKFSFELLDENGVVLEKDLNEIKSGKIKCTVLEKRGTIVLALYKDDVLMKISFDGFIDVPEITNGSYRLMAAEWNMENLEPLAECRNILRKMQEVEQ